MDVVVVGGGVIGASIAWRAAATGMKVAVVDDASRPPASRVAAGMLAPVTEAGYGEEELLRLNLASSERFPGFVEELREATGADPGYRMSGTVMVARDQDDNAALEDVFRFQTGLGLDVSRLRGRDCRALEPSLSPRIRGGILIAGDHQIDPPAFLDALLDACKRSGVELRSGRVVALERNRERVTGVRVENGDLIACRDVVLAGGAWSGLLDGMERDVLPPVRPVKGQLVHLRARSGEPLPRRNVRGLDVYLVFRSDGRVVVGASVEEQAYDVTVTAGATYELLRAAYELVPGISELELVGVPAGLRPATPDNGPVLGSLAPGLSAATGHFRNGVLLAPITAEAITTYLTSGTLPDVAAPFVASRFWERGA